MQPQVLKYPFVCMGRQRPATAYVYGWTAVVGARHDAQGKARVGNHDMVGGTGERSRDDVGEAVMREMGKGTKRSMGREKINC